MERNTISKKDQKSNTSKKSNFYFFRKTLLATVILFISVMFSACGGGKLNKSIFEELSTKELSNIIKKNPSFFDFYNEISELRSDLKRFDDISMAKFYDITYKRLFKYYNFMVDEKYWKSVNENSSKEWEKDFFPYYSIAEKNLNNWKKYLDDNSLDKYVRIQFLDLKPVEFNGRKTVNFEFKLTPLQGIVEEIIFTYWYQEKRNSYIYPKEYCGSRTPFSSPIDANCYHSKGETIHERVKYGDIANTLGAFLNDYNFFIEITSICKDGVNIKLDEIKAKVPERVSYWLNNLNANNTFEANKDAIARDVLEENFIDKNQYLVKKRYEILEKKDKLSFELMKNY